uniref:Caspase activity and apoptosis inhibitor 1 n=1 Tax=Erpetoichthys calabaricus TaxID=27687 RepID=A0A8C4SJ01_ERPCA
MTGKKSSKEKKRKHSHSDGRHLDRKRRSTESRPKDVKSDRENEGVEEPSDIEEGGLNLSVPFKPISAYITDRKEMLEQCFRVIGEKTLQKMLPDELKNCSYDEIKKLCMDQLEQISEKNLLQILEGEDLPPSAEIKDDEKGVQMRKTDTETQQDNRVDSTSSFKQAVGNEEHKQERPKHHRHKQTWKSPGTTHFRGPV